MRIEGFLQCSHCSTAQQAMSNLNTFTELLENVEATVSLFIAMRDQMSDDEWDTLNNHPLLSPLLDSLSDIEYTVGT